MSNKQQLEWQMTCIIDDITALEDGTQNDLIKCKLISLEQELQYVMTELEQERGITN